MSVPQSQFIAYLEELAILHEDIRHTPENTAFINLFESDNPNAMLKSKLKRVPCIIVKDYDFSYSDNRSDQIEKKREVDMMVVGKLGKSATAETIQAVWEITEEIGEEILMRIKKDKRPEARSLNLNNVKGAPADLEMDSLYATIFTIPLSSFRNNDITPGKWSDL